MDIEFAASCSPQNVHPDGNEAFRTVINKIDARRQASTPHIFQPHISCSIFLYLIFLCLIFLLTIVYVWNIHILMDTDEIFSKCIGFDWDDGNLLKNWEKHGVSAAECEQVFFNQPLVTSSDVGHSSYEARFYSLGKSDSGKHLFIVFTVRNNLIRIISARNMNRKERGAYKHHEKNT